jgi:hypothetical protein
MVRNHEGSGNAPMIACDYTAASHSFTGRPAMTSRHQCRIISSLAAIALRTPRLAYSWRGGAS